MVFRSSVSVQLDASCNEIRPNYTSSVKFNEIKEATFETPISFLTTNQSSVIASQRMTVLENNLNKYMTCMNNDLLLYRKKASQIVKNQDTLKQRKEELKKKKEISSEASERSKLVTDPYSQTSYHESWFPLGRPIKKDNIPVLLSFSIFFLVFALAMFLRLSSIDLRFTPFMSGPASFRTNFIYTKT